MGKKIQAVLLVLFIVAVVALALMEGGGKRGGVPLVVDMPAPDFELTDTSGRIWKLSEMKGKVVFINFWATWCPSCVSEMPSINNLYLMAGGTDGFQILTVLYQDSPEAAIKFFEEEGYGMPILIDKGERAAYMYGLTGVPETYIIDKKGVLRHKQIGPRHFDTPDMVEFINSLIEEPV